MPRLNLQNLAFEIEPLSTREVAAACQLEVEAGLSSVGETAMLARLANPQSLILAVFRSVDSALIGLFSGWVVMDELEVDNLVVAASMRKQGVGLALLRVALQQAWQRGARLAFLEVRESNLAAVSLYASVGFSAAGRRRAYYQDPLEDALTLRLEIAQAATKLNLRLS